MFSIFAHVMKTVRDTNSKPGLPVVGTPIRYVTLGPGVCVCVCGGGGGLKESFGGDVPLGPWNP